MAARRWRFFDTIGELHFAFSLIGQVVSRVRLYPAIVTDPERPPIDLKTFLDSMDDKGGMTTTRIVADKAMALTKDLTENTPGRASGMLRTMAMNLSVPGEVYLVHDEKTKQWLVLSSEEITSVGNRYKIRRARAGNNKARGARDRRPLVRGSHVALAPPMGRRAGFVHARRARPVRTAHAARPGDALRCRGAR